MSTIELIREPQASVGRNTAGLTGVKRRVGNQKYFGPESGLVSAEAHEHPVVLSVVVAI